MKIGQPNDHSAAITQASQPSTAKAGQQEAANAVRSERKTPSASVTVSTLARGLEKASNEPEIDIDKVNAVRQAIADKTYSVNPQAIADKLLANAHEMLQRAKP